MAAYSCYYDASGSQDKSARPLVVVGLLSSVRKWVKCEQEWEQVLEDFQVPYLHMKEFAHSTGPFTEWKGDHARRSDFLGRLIKLLKKRVNIAFQYRLVPDVFHRLDGEYLLTEAWGNPYAFTAAVTIRMAQEWFDSSYPNEELTHVVEKGDAGQGQLLGQFAGLPFVPVLKAKVDDQTARHLVPFQAVDLIAYEARLNIERHLEGKRQVIRQSLAELRKIPHRAYLCDEEVLRVVIAQNPEVCPPRTRVGGKG